MQNKRMFQETLTLSKQISQAVSEMTDSILTSAQQTKQKIDEIRYSKRDLLSSSETADVYKCQNQGESEKEFVAVKIFKKQLAFETEKNVLKALQKSPCVSGVIQLKEDLEDQENKILKLDYAKNGTLFNLVVNKNGLSEDEAHKYFIQLMNVVDGIHKKNIVHRDIKLENILLHTDEQLILCDFANAVELDNVTEQTFIPSAGTIGCRAPEIINIYKNNQNQQGNYNIDFKKADIFSLGVVLFTMVVCKQPFAKADISDFYFSTFIKSKNKFWNLFVVEPSPQFKELINGLIEPDPQNRFTIEKIIESKWVKQARNQKK